MKKILGIMTLIVGVMLVFGFTACDPDDTGSGNDITWSASQTGGTSGSVNSTGIVITFSEALESLNLSEVNISGAASKSGSAITGSGATWTVPITVSSQGNASVSISKTGVASGAQNVAVFKAGSSSGNLSDWTLPANLKVVSKTSSLGVDSFTTTIKIGNEYYRTTSARSWWCKYDPVTGNFIEYITPMDQPNGPWQILTTQKTYSEATYRATMGTYFGSLLKNFTMVEKTTPATSTSTIVGRPVTERRFDTTYAHFIDVEYNVVMKRVMLPSSVVFEVTTWDETVTNFGGVSLPTAPF